MNKTRFLYFDLGNVILNFDHRRMCQQAAQVAGITTDDAHRLLFESDLQRRLEIGEISSEAYWDQFREATGASVELTVFEHAISDIFALNVDIVPIIMQLAAARNRLGILSNTCGPHWQHISDGRFGIIPELFEHAILSFQVTAAKPGPEIYEIASRQAGVKPNEIFFVDDRPENVAGAQAAGMDAVRFTGAADLAVALHRRGVGFNY